jgi:hypothetical protein
MCTELADQQRIVKNAYIEIPDSQDTFRPLRQVWGSANYCTLLANCFQSFYKTFPCVGLLWSPSPLPSLLFVISFPLITPSILIPHWLIELQRYFAHFTIYRIRILINNKITEQRMDCLYAGSHISPSEHQKDIERNLKYNKLNRLLRQNFGKQMRKHLQVLPQRNRKTGPPLWQWLLDATSESWEQNYRFTNGTHTRTNRSNFTGQN